MVNKTKEVTQQVIDFTKQLMRLIVTVAFLGLGAYSVYLGRNPSGMIVKSALLVSAGTIVGCYGFIELYKTLTRKVA